MGTKANPAMIGAFVVGAIALGVIGLLVFGSGQLFKSTTRAVCFFSGDTMGLNVGAPVKFKGVEIGSVAQIRIRIGEETMEVSSEAIAQGIRIPVIIEIDNDKVIAEGAKSIVDPAHLARLIELGLRAQLVSQSMVTGLLLVQLDFRPEMPAVFILPKDAKIIEIPTIPTSMQMMQSAAQEIIKKLEQINFDHLVETASDAAEGISELTRAPGLRKAVEMLPDTIGNVNQAVGDLRGLVVRLDHNQGPLLQSLTDTANKTDATLDQAQATLLNVQDLLAPNAPLAVDLAASLKAVANAARSIKLLADYLERNPSAIVRGKPERSE